MWTWFIGCHRTEPPVPEDTVPVVVYDVGADEVPLPNDLVRDAGPPRLALAVESAGTPAERAYRTLLNTQDAWSSTAPVTFTLSTAASAATLTAGSVRVLRGDAFVPEDGAVRTLGDGGTSVQVLPPATGWAAGERYAVVVLGGTDGLQTPAGTPFGADTSYAALAGTEALTLAFPGQADAARADQIARDGAAREVLADVFTWAEGAGIDRDDIAAAWTFTVTVRPEVATDVPSARVPIPYEPLRDPGTGRIAVPLAPDAPPLEVDAATVLADAGGFSVTADPAFDVTFDLDPTGVAGQVELWKAGRTPAIVPSTATVWRAAGPCAAGDAGCRSVTLHPDTVLDPGETYAVVVRTGARGADGSPLAPMGPAVLLRVDEPLADGGVSQIGGVSDADAALLEVSRALLAPVLDAAGRDDVVAAWPFVTLDPEQSLRDAIDAAETFGYDPSPTIERHDDAADPFGDDALGWLFPPSFNPAWLVYESRVDHVAQVYEGHFERPDYLDPVTRTWTEPTLRDLWFVLTLPDGVDPDVPVPVVVFGHGLLNDRRWVMTVSSELAKRGFAVVSIDFPYHGARTACVGTSLVAIPNVVPPALRDDVGYTDELISLWPCVSEEDAECSPDGACLDADGDPEPFASMPLVDLQPAAGAALLYLPELPRVPERMRQALVDLGALRFVLSRADWRDLVGQELATDEILYAGQSLGGIVGAVYAGLDPAVSRAVLNVPAADVVDVFAGSTFFAPQLETFAASIGAPPGSYAYARLLNRAKWLTDSVDPAAVGHVWRESGKPGLIQMDRVDATTGDLVIPNAATDLLADVTGLPVTEYASVLHADLTMPVIGDDQLVELAQFLADE